MFNKLCIPKLEKKYQKEDIINLINSFDLGIIKDINLINCSKDNANSKTAFIFMEKWNSNEKVKTIFERFNLGKDIKLVVSPPMYWKVVVAR